MDIDKYLQPSGGTNWYNVPYVTKAGDRLSDLRGLGDIMTSDQYTKQGGTPNLERYLIKENGKYSQNSAFTPGSTIYIATQQPDAARSILSRGSGGGVQK